MLGVSLLVVAHLSFASLFSCLFLHVPRLSSSANRFPVRVVIRSCGAHVLHRAAPTPKVSSWISTPGDGRRLRFGVVCVVTLRQQPQATGDQAWDECSSRGDDRRSDAGPRRSRCSRCRGQAFGQGPDSGHGRSCPGVLPPFEIDRARTRASVRQAPAGRANEHAAQRRLNSLPRAAGTGTDSRLPRWRFTNDRRPRLLTLPSIVRPPLSRFTVFSSFPPLWSCPAARRPVPQ